MKSIIAFRFSLFFSVLLLGFNVRSQTDFYAVDSVQKIKLFFSQSDWDYQLDTAKYGVGGYVVADSVIVNGTRFFYVGVKYKGNSSYDSTKIKNPLHIELDYLINQSYKGYTDIKLSNGYGDPSLLREVLAYDILKNYMHCPKSNFAQLFINGNYIGIYSSTENINKDFCSTHFNSSVNTFLKCNPVVIPTPLTKSNLKYISNDSSAYFNFYELKSTTGWNDLVALCDTVTNFSASIPNVMDVDRALWMLAFNNVLINLDSYSGVFAQNYYLYKDNTNHFNPIVWDLNMSFGGFPYVGSGQTSMGGLTVSNMQQLPAMAHSTDPYWPLIKNLFSSAQYKRMYIAHMRTILNEAFVSGDYLNKAQQFQSLVDTAVLADSNKFFSYLQFQNAITQNVVFGSYTVPGISTLMASRISYLQSTAEFTAQPPAISLVAPDSIHPALNSFVTIRATVTNANAVYLGYRIDYNQKFTRILMYDDGLHNDGAAGDLVYASGFTLTSAQAQYYIYAENSAAGMFSPERAEHEFYTIVSSLPTAYPGQIRINEFVAINNTGQVNELGAHEDWIELYNTTSAPLELFGLYLSDDSSNLFKFPFPPNTIIQPNSLLIVWADEKVNAGFLHSNFKLSGLGERILLSDASGNILDSISFGPPITDVSYGRCPDGTGNFIAYVVPTFNASNCTVGWGENVQEKFAIFPNPAGDQVWIVSASSHPVKQIEIINTLGETIVSKNGNQEAITAVDLSSLPAGFYFIRVNQSTAMKIIRN